MASLPAHPYALAGRVADHAERVAIGAGVAWLVAAQYLAVLAYPEDTPARARCIAAAQSLLGDVTHTPPSRRVRTLMERGPLVAASRRIERERLPAASIALGIVLREASRGAWLKCHPTVAGRPITGVRSAALAIVDAAMSETATGDPLARANNFLSRHWSASKPVLHLACALLLSAEAAQQSASDPAPLVPRLLHEPAWASTALAISERWRVLLAGVPRLRIALATTISVAGVKK
jgi:hypothetical protein